MIRFVLSVISVNLYNDQTRCFVDRMRKYFSSLLGCRNYQGYLFSQPLPLPEFEAFLHAGAGWSVDRQAQ